jgi:TolB-like protein/DNA-binding winged helix-turn-helix (wHTH) protein/Tfp pilus assembly protein PilF
MAEASKSLGSVQFGPFELLLDTQELRKHGLPVKLSGQAIQILIVLATRPGQLVTREELQRKLWPTDSYGDFEHGLNAAINKLREKLGDSATTPTYIETLPGRGYRFIGTIETLPSEPPARSAAADKQPLAGASEPVSVSGIEVRQAKSKRWLWIVAIVALLAVFLTSASVLYVAFEIHSLYWQRVRSMLPGASQPIRSLAVLPLTNLSHDPEQEYFADGMTESLITELSQISSLKVISRTSAMHYKGSNKPLPEIAKELNVDGIIEGSVLRADGRVRITAQLVNAASDTHLWAKSYDRDLRDVLRLQGEIAHAIADEVKANVNPDVKARLANARPVDPRAHDAYLRGQFFLNKITDEDLQKASEYAKQAVEIDPSYAQAYGLMALSYWMRSHNAYGRLTETEAADKTRAAATKGIAIDDTLAEPHVALGLVLLYHDWDWTGAQRELKRAIELNPNLGLAHWVGYAWWLGFMGYQDEAIGEAKRGVELDPFSPGSCHSLASMYYFGHKYDEALAQIRKCVEMFPDNWPCYFWSTRILRATGLYDQEIAAGQKLLTLAGQPGDAASLGRAYALGGINGAKHWELQQAKKARADRYEFAPIWLARLYASLGEKDTALDWLQRGYEEHDDQMYSIKVDPRFDSLRSDPRFQDLVRRMNFPQ